MISWSVSSDARNVSMGPCSGYLVSFSSPEPVWKRWRSYALHGSSAVTVSMPSISMLLGKEPHNRRLIPLHRDLLALGILDHVKRAEDRLFRSYDIEPLPSVGAGRSRHV